MAANRVKTVEYMLPNLLTSTICQTAAGTYIDSGDLTVYLPETTSRVILGARIEAFAYNTAYVNGSDHNRWGIRCSCDGGTNWTAVTQSAMYTESDENDSVFMIADVTAEFTARFSGASDTVRWGYYITADAVNTYFGNASAKLILTYEYDDTAHDTRIKTVRIPIESLNGRLGTAGYTEICQDGGANDQIPVLTGGATPFLPENTPVIRQKFLELWTNTAPSGTTDGVVTLRIDSAGTSQAYAQIDNTTDTGTAHRFMLDITAEASTTSHNVQGITTGASMCAQIGGWLTVTYEYAHGASSTILNSLFIGFGEDPMGVPASAQKSVQSVDRYIMEENVTLKQSGLWITMQTSATNQQFNLKVGGQTTTGYATMIDGAASGMVSIVQRVDSQAYRGAGITVAHGLNTWTAEWYTATVGAQGNASAMLILNYTSDKAGGGDGIHARSVYFPILDSARAVNSIVTGTAAVVPKIIENPYWLVAANPFVYSSGLMLSTTAVGVSAIKVSPESPVGEHVGLFSGLSPGGNENGIALSNGVCRSQFKRWPTDPDPKRIDVEGNRTWVVGGNVAQYGLGLWITFHSHTWTVSGTVSGYGDADGAGLTVRLCRVDDGEFIGEVTTSAGGAFTFTWFNDEDEIRTICQEDASHVGCSVSDTAS